MFNSLIEKNKILDQILKIKPKLSIFFCGIGGIGMSGLAYFASSRGHFVSGSNDIENDNLLKLKNDGFTVFTGHNPDNIKPNFDVFVYTPSISKNNPEYLYAISKGLPIFTRAEFLAYLMQNEFNIVIAGSHGKTTTTAITAHVIESLNLNPSVILGGIMKKYDSNFYLNNQSNTFIVESDESDGSFAMLPTDIGLINNIDQEHMDFYKTEENLISYFTEFGINAARRTGLALSADCIRCNNLENTFRKHGTVITYGFNDKADIVGQNIRYQKDGILFDIIHKPNNVTYTDVKLSTFGKCNVSNALGTIAIASLLNQSIEHAINALASFSGVEKRFSILGKINNMLIVDDYAHNPQKIRSAIQTAKHFIDGNSDNGKLIVVFEPHRYTRVSNLFNDFSESFGEADSVFVTDIYSASEEPIDGINNTSLRDSIREHNIKCDSVNSNADDIYASLEDHLLDNGVILFTGAGNSSKFAKYITKKYGKN